MITPQHIEIDTWEDTRGNLFVNARVRVARKVAVDYITRERHPDAEQVARTHARREVASALYAEIHDLLVAAKYHLPIREAQEAQKLIDKIDALI